MRKYQSALLVIVVLSCTSASAFQLTGSHWAQSTMEFSLGDLCDTVNFPETPGDCSGTAGNPDWGAEFMTVMQRWNNATQVYSFTTNNNTVTGNCTSANPNSAFFLPDICGQAFGGSTLAVSATSFSIPGFNVVHNDIVFNTNKDWDAYDGVQMGATIDFRRVAVHEAGHSLGLGHTAVPDVNPDPIMTPLAGSTIAPQNDDILGVDYIYGLRDNDLNADRNHDVFLRRQTDGAFTGYEIDGNSVDATNKPPINLNTNWDVVAVKNFDGTAGVDVLFRNSVNNQWYIATLNGATVTDSGIVALPTNTNWQMVAADDFDGDGACDILLRNMVNGKWRVYLMDGTTIDSQGELNITTSANWEFVATGDTDRDGNADVVLRNSNNNSWRLYRLSGLNVLENAALALTTNASWAFQVADDFSGDRGLDILVRNTVNGKWRLYVLGDGAVVRSTDFVNLNLPLEWQVAGIADANFDGRQDILLRHSGNGRWRLFLMNGTIVVDAAVMDFPTNLLWVLQEAGDFDFDQRADVLFRNTNNGRWLINTLRGTTIQSNEFVLLTSNPTWQRAFTVGP